MQRQTDLGGKIRVLLRLNRLTSARIRSTRFFYYLLVAFSVLASGGYWGFIVGVAGLDTMTAADIRFALSFGIVVLLFFEAFFLLGRFQKNSLLEPYHLRLFPLSVVQVVGYIYASLIVDAKSTMYGVNLGLLIVYFAVHGSLLQVIVAVLLAGAFLFTVLTLVIAVYALAGRWLARNREGLVALIHLSALLIVLVNATQTYYLLNHIPIVNFVVDGLYGVFTGDLNGSLLNLSYLTLSSLAGIAAIYYGSRRAGGFASVESYAA